MLQKFRTVATVRDHVLCALTPSAGAPAPSRSILPAVMVSLVLALIPSHGHCGPAFIEPGQAIIHPAYGAQAPVGPFQQLLTPTSFVKENIFTEAVVVRDLRTALRTSSLPTLRRSSDPCRRPTVKRMMRRMGPEATCLPDRKVRAQAVPNDSYFSLLWGLKNSIGPDIGATTAWDTATGSRSVVVAVVDEGVQYDHPDLLANMWTNFGELAGNGRDDDGNGVVDDVYGYNASSSGSASLLPGDHGTHVAGIIGARGNNSVGVCGVNWDIRIMSVQVFDSKGDGLLSYIERGLSYVRKMKDRGVPIVATNNSYGFDGALDAGTISQLTSDIEALKAKGILYVVAAGNDGSDNDNSPKYPSSIAVENVISVAALRQNGNLASFSNYGASTVNIAAPGEGIGSTVTDGKYEYMSGTSMATPFVTGAAALLKGAYPNLGYAELRSLLLDSAQTLDSLTGQVSTGGLLSLDGALTLANTRYGAANIPTPDVTPKLTSNKSTAEVGKAFVLTLNGTAGDQYVLNYKFRSKLCPSSTRITIGENQLVRLSLTLNATAKKANKLSVLAYRNNVLESSKSISVKGGSSKELSAGNLTKACAGLISAVRLKN